MTISSSTTFLPDVKSFFHPFMAVAVLNENYEFDLLYFLHSESHSYVQQLCVVILYSVGKQSLQTLCQNQQNHSVVESTDLLKAAVYLSLRFQMSSSLESRPSLK